jgi:phage repressor protein C with HTH and peptisase S24 domain
MNTLGSQIKALRKVRRLSQQELAHACGWESQSRIGNYEKGTREPSLQDLKKIADALGVDIPELLNQSDKVLVTPRHNREAHLRTKPGTLDTPMDGHARWESGKTKAGRVPVVGNAQLGEEGYFEALDLPAESQDGYINIHSDDPDAYGMRVMGDGMLPRIKNGEFVLIEPNKRYVSGDEVMVRTVTGRTMIREFIYLRDGMYRLDSVNAEHGSIHIAESDVLEVHLIGGILKSSRFYHASTEKNHESS